MTDLALVAQAQPPLKHQFFEGDRPHSRPKRQILRNVLGAVYPFYWYSERAFSLRREELFSRHALNPNENDENEAPGNEDFAENGSGGVDAKERQVQLWERRAEEAQWKMEQLYDHRGSASLNYLDGFAGRGSYNADARQQLEDDLSDWGSPIIAVAKALEALNNSTQNKFQEIFSKHEFAVNFIFNEKDRDNLKYLKALVAERFGLYGWKPEEAEEMTERLEDSIVYEGQVRPRGDSFVRKAKIRVQYFNREFHQLDLDAIPSPLFSFIDPFGISSIPMDAMKKLVGADREVFLNLMVATINRNVHNLDKPNSAISKLYDCMLPKVGKGG